MADLRERDLIYDRGRPEPYGRSGRPVYRSPSPSPDRARYERRAPRYHDDLNSDDGRGGYFRDEPRLSRPLHRAHSPDYDRRILLDREREREREYVHRLSPSPPPIRRPGVLRRQSSLDTYDRPRGNDFHFLDREREEYRPLARREDIRPQYGNLPIPPRAPAAHRLDFRDEESLRGPYRPDHDRIREREVVKVKKRRSGDSLTSKTFSRTSRTSSSSSRESSPSRGTSVRSDYPKKGKTRIPGRLISKRALIDLGYPFLEEGKTVIILKALGQDQIDQVLKVSEEYKKAELEVSAARSSAGDILEDHREEFRIPPHTHTPSGDVEVLKQVAIRDVAPPQSSTTTSYSPTTMTGTSSASTITGAPLVLRTRSRSRSGREIRAEIRALEAELHDGRRHHHHHHRRRRSGSVGGELMRVEKTADGQQVVLFEERVEKVDEGHRGPRIERDKRGRLSLSVPRRR